MRKFTWLLYVCLLVAVLIGIRIWFLQPEKNASPMGPGGGVGKAMNVDGFIIVSSQLDNEITIAGNILPYEKLDLRPEIAGKITGIYFQEGQMVSTGKLLVKLFDADLQANLNKIKAQIKLASAKEQRLSALLKVQGVSREEYDVVLNELEQLKAEKEIVEVQIGRTEIKAPFSGKTGFRAFSMGSYITPQDIITTIEQLQPVKIECSLPEKYSHDAQPGKTFHFTVAGSEKQFAAKVYARNPAIDVNTRSLRIRAIADNRDLALSPGGFANVTFPLNVVGNALMIPSSAIIPILKGQQVFIAKNGKAVPVKIETGVRTDQQVQVTSGLMAGDTLILTGLMSLRPDMPITIAQIKEPSL